MLAAQFVLSLYVCTPRGRPPNRDDPAVVKARFVRVGVASIIAPFVSILAAALPGDTEPCIPDASLLQWFGLWAPERVGAAVFAPLLLTVILFLGPLVMAWIEECDTPWQLRLRQMVHAHRDVRSLRNLLIGPLAEEWVFRACMCSLLYGAGIRDGTNVFISGTLFGLAHVHHVYDAGASLAVVGVQFTYTSLFGAYSSYLFLRTGPIYGRPRPLVLQLTGPPALSTSLGTQQRCSPLRFFLVSGRSSPWSPWMPSSSTTFPLHAVGRTCLMETRATYENVLDGELAVQDKRGSFVV